MKLLVGVPGSGKTTRVLQEFSAAPSGRALLVVPTATMAEHLQHLLARQRIPIPPSQIITLSRLASLLAPGCTVADSAAIALLASLELSNNPNLYPELRDAPGLPAAIAAAMEELANSGCGALEWASLASLDHRFPPQFGTLCSAIEHALAQAGILTRPQWLQRAASKALSDGVPWSQIWFDGFTHFSAVELRLLDALRRHSQLTVTLPEWLGADRIVEHFRQSGARVEYLQCVRPQPTTQCIEAASREREASEIALRILDLHRDGYAWRDIGIIVRNEQDYLALLERTLSRVGIPFRAYFGRSLLHESAGIFFSRFAAAVGSGWEGLPTLHLLRHPLCRAASRLAGERWIHALQKLPFSGLHDPRCDLGAPAYALKPFEHWASASLDPNRWASMLPQVSSLLEPPPTHALSQEQLHALRLHAAVFQAIFETAQRLAPLLPQSPIPFAEFWRRLEPALRETRVYPRGGPRDVVHILDVEEARQWELPVVFVCGLLEGEFPRHASPDPLLPEDIRRALNDHNIPVATRPDREELERFHFEIAVSRPTSRLFLSWPAHNEKGEPNLRSFAVDTSLYIPNLASSQPTRARQLRIRPSRPAAPAPRPALQSEEILRSLRAIHARLAVTAIDSYLKCPFQFFARYTMGLNPLPPLPAERINHIWLGNLAHAILREWHERGGDIESLTEELWDRQLHNDRLTENYQSILDRAAMKRCLRAYAANPSLSQVRPGWTVCLESKLSFPLKGINVECKIDRYDTSPDGDCIVYDFKYSSERTQEARKEITIQGGLYAYALQEQKSLHPLEIHIIPLKKLAKSSESNKGEKPKKTVDKIITDDKQKAETAIEKIRSGNIEVHPAIPDLCKNCDFRDACRRHEQAAVQFAAGGRQEGGEEGGAEGGEEV